MVWIQPHNLPVELWDGESMEYLTEPFGRLMNVDEYTSTLAHAHFMRVYMEIDLSQPLKRGFWIEDYNSKVFIMILYERLPTFCFTCGMDRHGSNGCTHRSMRPPEDQTMDEATDDGCTLRSIWSYLESLQVRPAVTLIPIDFDA